MQSKAVLAIAVAVVVIIVGIGAFMFLNNNGNNDSPTGEVTDALGRTIKIPSDLDNGIVTIGSTGPLRFASIFDVYDRIIEVDKGDITDNKNGRAYSYAYPYDKLDVETQSHADNKLESATVESIGKKNPSLVITSAGVWNNYAENFQTLAKKVTVMVLKDQQMQYMTEDGKLAEFITFNIELLGKVLKKESRATEVIDGINGIIADIASLKGTSDRSIYVAGVTISGSNTLNTTFPRYIPFDLTGSKNAYAGGSTDSKVVLSPEEVAKMDIDMIIIDPSSSDKVKEQDSQAVLSYLYGLDESERPDMYITVPIVWDSINYDCALASAFVVTYLNYQGSLTLEQLEQKVVNVFKTFYGTHGDNVLKDMKTFFEGKSSSNGQEMPIFQEVEVVKNGDMYALAAA
jgi:iron complex transport system substrate-binding protein